MRLTDRHKRWGFGLMLSWLRKNGYIWNHKRVYGDFSLHLGMKGKKRWVRQTPISLHQPDRPNIFWSMDFMSDSLRCGQKFRTLNVLDDFNREFLSIEIDFSLPAERVVRVLEQVSSERGYPRFLRVDNGPELISRKLLDWGQANDVIIRHIQPGKPTQNGYIERFNRTYREDVLDQYWFDNLKEAREITSSWRAMHNGERPHSALGKLTPWNFLENHR